MSKIFLQYENINFIRLMGKGARGCFEIWLLRMEPQCNTEIQD